MFEKDTAKILYTRKEFTVEETIYDNYINMRKAMSELEKYKYDNIDKYLTSEDFKQGFLAGVKIMSSILLDI